MAPEVLLPIEYLFVGYLLFKSLEEIYRLKIPVFGEVRTYRTQRHLIHLALSRADNSLCLSVRL